MEGLEKEFKNNLEVIWGLEFESNSEAIRKVWKGRIWKVRERSSKESSKAIWRPGRGIWKPEAQKRLGPEKAQKRLEEAEKARRGLRSLEKVLSSLANQK